MAVLEDGPPAAPRLAEPSLSLRLQCGDLNLDLAIVWPVKSSEPVQFERVVAALASLGFLGSAYDLTKEAELERFGHATQRKDALRKEQHEFYVQVAQRYASMSETLQTMKRDYYRELDHLRQQLSKQKRDPSFEADEVYFFDPAAYKLPAWEDVVDQLDGMRMKRELLLQQLGGERIRKIPMHMLCQKCRSKFQAPREDDSTPFCERGTQTLPSEEVEDVCVQTDWRVVLKPNSHGQPVLEVEVPGGRPPSSGLPGSALPAGGLSGTGLPARTLPADTLPLVGGPVQDTGGAVADDAACPSAAQALPDSQGIGQLFNESGEAELGQAMDKAFMQQQSELQHAAQPADDPNPPDIGEDSAAGAAATQGLHDVKGEELLEPQRSATEEPSGGILGHKEAAASSAAVGVHVSIPKVCHIAVQTDDEPPGIVGATAANSSTTRRFAEPHDAGTRGRQPKKSESTSVESRVTNHAGSESSLPCEDTAGESGHIKRRPLSAEDFSERAHRMGAALQRVFSTESNSQKRRSFSLWKRKKMSRKELAALRLQRQMLALQKHQERQALSRLKRTVDVDKSREPAPEVLSARDSATASKPLGVPVHQPRMDLKSDMRCSNGTAVSAGEDAQSEERRVRRQQRWPRSMSLEEVDLDSKRQLSPHPDLRDHRPTSSGRNSRRPASSGGELSSPSGQLRVTPREVSTAMDPRSSGKGLAQIQLGLQANSLKPSQRGSVRSRQPALEPVRDLPHKLAARHGSRQSSPKPPLRSSPPRSSPDPPTDRRQSSFANSKGATQSSSLGSVSLPHIATSSHYSDDGAMRRSTGDLRSSALRVSSANRQ